ncbi:tryptophan--tRNA ligase [Comamonas testosteroni]|uniref:Tryptophan--tRNA ligase n=1 Tax=Comamonas testosteroni TaxID=285 RepID=A0A373FT91_COMTE|nr:tryptophan--tRNA ligase [Comamonas testosteroni]RGE46685.1 tryptophan--tRNA ligase [Comamonas testosteroni]
MSTTRFLTGITPSGTPHLGNYAGMMRPAIEASRAQNVENFYFLADYHALIKCQDPERVQRSTIEIAASWLAAGLNPEHVTFYRQSDIPEIPELTWFLTCVTGKGLLNRAHAYKASVDKNHAAGVDADDGVTAGLFMYPVLMGADILAFNAHKVPVGRDQVQHLEMARDMASSFNHIYGGEYFTLPEAVVEESVATLPGLDGRKMSKSYNNTIPLFTPRDQLKKLINSITTDSRAPGEPKEVEGSALFQIYQAFASEEETEALRQQYAAGITWGDAKQMLFERIDREIAPMRERYEYLIAHPAELEEILLAGAAKARKLATPFVQQLRSAVGIRNLAATVKKAAKAAKTALPQFKQYREADGQFYFKLVAADGQLLLQSQGFAAPKEAGQSIAQLQREGASALAALKPRLQTVDGVQDQQVVQALDQLREAAEQ